MIASELLLKSTWLLNGRPSENNLMLTEVYDKVELLGS
jgi:hypothetical protein